MNLRLIYFDMAICRNIAGVGKYDQVRESRKPTNDSSATFVLFFSSKYLVFFPVNFFL